MIEVVGEVTKEKIIESIRKGAILTDPGTILGHLCVILISISENVFEGNDEIAHANAMDGCEIATECVEMWIRKFDEHSIYEMMAEMSKVDKSKDVQDLLDHLASIKLLARRGRSLLDAKKVPN